MSFIFLIIIFFIAAAAVTIFLKNEKWIRLSASLFAIVGSGLVLLHVLPVLFGQADSWHDNICLVDNFSALMVLLISFVYVMASIISVGYMKHEHEEGIVSLKDLKIYFALLHLFVLCMLITVLANNSLLLWIALEGTTLSSTFLVGLYRKKSSVEAAWKYIIICSTGISLGLIGILLLGHGLSLSGAEGGNAFLLSSLIQNAHLISPEIVKWAFVFLFVGFGAKVGFVPMHTWLPDAHSKAPSPISALFSGILLNVALYAIIRFKFITDSALGQSDWTSHLFLFFGTISILLPALMMLVQSNYKRMLAYSSVEHMGIITFALSLSPVGAIAAVIHMIGHTLTKSLLFFGAGEILLKFKTTNTEKIKGLLKKAPKTAILFLLGILAIIALPPSALFISEYTIFTNAFALHPALSLLIFIALSIIAYSMLKSTISMFFSADSENDPEIKKEKWNATHSIMALQLILIVVFAIFVSSTSGLKFIDSIAKNTIYISK